VWFRQIERAGGNLILELSTRVSRSSTPFSPGGQSSPAHGPPGRSPFGRAAPRFLAGPVTSGRCRTVCHRPL